jgi:putative phosphoesterase
VYLIGLISDTHGLLRPEAVAAMHGCDQIIHAGDVGRPEILDELRAIAPVVAVRGNVDIDAWADRLPETAVSGNIFVIHDVKQIQTLPPGCDIVVSGHSHKPGQQERAGILYVNPGSAGPRRFRLPITVARLHPNRRVEFIELTPKRSP